MDYVYRKRKYEYQDVLGAWYEKCAVTKETSKRITVQSQTSLKRTQFTYPDGSFILNKERLLCDGKIYHSRHGEWFYREIPEDVSNVDPDKVVENQL